MCYIEDIDVMCYRQQFPPMVTRKSARHPVIWSLISFMLFVLKTPINQREKPMLSGHWSRSRESLMLQNQYTSSQLMSYAWANNMRNKRFFVDLRYKMCTCKWMTLIIKMEKSGFFVCSVREPVTRGLLDVCVCVGVRARAGMGDPLD